MLLSVNQILFEKVGKVSLLRFLSLSNNEETIGSTNTVGREGAFSKLKLNGGDLLENNNKKCSTLIQMRVIRN